MTHFSTKPGPIGVFDSGYGGLTILNGIRKALPQYDYIYLGDNARAPYGNRSFELVYEFTREAVLCLFDNGCHLVILGCNHCLCESPSKHTDERPSPSRPSTPGIRSHPPYCRDDWRHHQDAARGSGCNTGYHQFGLLSARGS
jgi:hypothetical protein